MQHEKVKTACSERSYRKLVAQILFITTKSNKSDSHLRKFLKSIKTPNMYRKDKKKTRKREEIGQKENKQGAMFLVNPDTTVVCPQDRQKLIILSWIL
jgi:hypothetical protein